MSQKTKGLPYFQSIKSLPVDFRFMDSEESNSYELPEAVASSPISMVSDSIPENGELAFEDVDSKINRSDDDSPYSSMDLPAEEEPSTSDENLESVSSQLQSSEPPQDEFKWNDTTTYVAKKVTGVLSHFH